MKKFFFSVTVVLFLLSTNLFAQINARMLQYPDVSKTQIAFSYGGDIWIVAKEGGIAHKLTSAEGEEVLPHFSPDGSQIAFSGNYSGNVDVYTMPSMGGIPLRLTYHGMSDRIVDWYPDGKNILFASSRESGKQRFSQFYKVSDKGGLPEKLSVPYGEFAALSPDAKMIAYTPRTRVFRTWKRYRGGMATDIWIFNLQDSSSEDITNNVANDELPMWHGNKIYFLSDRGANERYNIWCYDLSTKQTRQITNFSDYDIHFPSIGPDDIVFEAGGLLYLLDLATEKYKEVKIDVVTDESTLMARTEKTEKLIQSFWLSHDGNRAVFEARGEIFSVPAENGPVINLTQSSGYAERYPSWSPDGKYVAYWSDRSGEYELTIRDMENPVKEKKLTSYGSGFRYQIYWSPDSKMLAFIDKAMTIYIYDKEKDRTIKVAKELDMYEGELSNFSVSWSPDSRYLAYSKNMDNLQNGIAIFDTKEEKTHVVTSGFYNDVQPVFDPGGKYLYFLTNRNFSPVYSDFDNTWVYPNATQIAVVPLTDEIPSPLAPKNDSASVKKEEVKKDEKKEDKKDEGKKDEEKKDEKKIKETAITFDGFEERLEILPPKGGNYSGLSAVKGKVIYHKFPAAGSGEENKPVNYYDFEKREEKTIVPDADAFQLSADGDKIIVDHKNSYYVVSVAPDQKLEKRMPTDQMEMTVVPREEWQQLFNDAWRFERDYFYDPNMHGLNWEAIKEQYNKLLKYAITRWDVNFVIGELISEISSSHTYRFGGDVENAPSKPVGYLGIDWGLKDGFYYVKRIVKGAPWDNEVRSPLDKPGLKIKEGDFILAVNNVPINTADDPWSAFQGFADKTVELTVNDKPTTDSAWTILVETLNDETRLRNLEWIESNRKRVDEETNGKVGYIYVPSTGLDGQYELVRMFYAQYQKEGLIIDERFNNGGQLPDRFVELFDRKPFSYFASRDGKSLQGSSIANFGPKVMLINGWSGSGGDAFPDYFKKAGLGPLIGTRTWGGLIGISGNPDLIDGGRVTVPTLRMYNPDGTWFKEGHGVDPDIEVVEDPTKLSKGVDVQLEKAIDEVMKKLKEKPTVIPEHPAYEKR